MRTDVRRFPVIRLAILLALPLLGCVRPPVVVLPPQSALPVAGSAELDLFAPRSNHLKCFWTFGSACGDEKADTAEGAMDLCGHLPGLEVLRCQPDTRIVATFLSSSYSRLLCQFVGALADERSSLRLPLQAVSMGRYLTLLERIVMSDGWARAEQRLLQAGSEADPLLKRIISFQRAYFEAYFRDGRFFRIEVTLEEFRDRLVQAIRQALPGSTWEKIAAMDFEKVEKYLTRIAAFETPEELKAVWRCLKGEGGDGDDCDKYLQFAYGAVSDSGLRLRSGEWLRVPPVSLRIDPTALEIPSLPEHEMRGVATTLVRVFIEALGDAVLGVPGIPEATGVQECGLKPFREADFHVCRFELQKLDRLANQAEAGTRGVVERLIRGLGWAALNNDALADVVTVLISVTVRKLTEKVIWCYLACRSEDPNCLQSEKARDGRDRLAVLPIRTLRVLVPSP